jgi:hypothetical protein
MLLVRGEGTFAASEALGPVVDACSLSRMQYSLLSQIRYAKEVS